MNKSSTSICISDEESSTSVLPDISNDPISILSSQEESASSIVHSHPHESGANNALNHAAEMESSSSSTEEEDTTMIADPQGWWAHIASFFSDHPRSLAVALAGTAAIAAETRHRSRLCQQSPLIFGQKYSSFQGGIRNMNPSPFIGTHNAVASTVAFLDGGPSHMPDIQFDQAYVMPHDSATVHLHWYFPTMRAKQEYLGSLQHHTKQRRLQIPTVLILHGINNHAAFGYMKRLAKTLVEEASYCAVTVDFRGANAHADSVRLYTASFTNDLRSVVQTLSQHCETLCLVGHSLGANIMTKYLGEEGDNCIIKAAVALANPASIDSRNASAVYSPLLAFGLKGIVWKNRSAWWDMMRLDHSFRERLRQLFTTWSLAGFDAAGSLVMVRNDRDQATRVGYADAEAYWKESSSYQYVPSIATPLLQVYSRDDHLVAPANRRTLRYNMSNPNVMVVETPCGGHLGWQESNGKNYAAHLTVEFFRSVLETPRHPSKL